MRILILALVFFILGCDASSPGGTYAPTEPVPEVADTTVAPCPVLPSFHFTLDYDGNIVKVTTGKMTTAWPEGQLRTVFFDLDPEGNIQTLRINNKAFIENTGVNYVHNGYGDVVVKKGQTATEIALSHNISLTTLKSLNPGVNLDKLTLNQILHVSDQD